MNIVLYNLNEMIKRNLRKTKNSIPNPCIVMSYQIKNSLGEGFENVPRFCENQEGERYRGVRLFVDPGLKSSGIFLFDYSRLRNHLQKEVL